MQSLGEAGWKNSQGIFLNKKKKPIIYLFILFLQAIGTTVKKKNKQKGIINIAGTNVDALGKEDDDEK